MRRTVGIDVLECPRCGGRLRLMARIEDARVVARMLRHLALPTGEPDLRVARRRWSRMTPVNGAPRPT